MRRYILLFIAATLLVACQQEADDQPGGYVPSGEAIAFEAVADDALTRAKGEITAEGTKKLKDVGFGVFGCYTGRMRYEFTNVVPDFMYNQQVTWASSAWTYAPTKYWPNDEEDYVSFFAYAPYEPSPSDTKCIAEFSKKDELGDPWLIYKLVQDPWKSTNEQTDLLYGVNSDTNQPWYNQQKTSYQVGDKMTFTFKHALACIGDVITICMTSNLSNMIAGYATITINRVVINYINLTSKARLVLNSKNTPNWKAVLSGEITTSRTYTKELSLTLTTDAQNISTDEGLFYIPLQVSTDKQQAVITVYYTVKNGVSKYDGEASKTIDLSEKVGTKEGLALILTQNLDLAHVVYSLGTDKATEPSYSRKR